MSVLVSDLRSIFLFAKFDDVELVDICRAMCARDYSARAIIFAQGEPSPGLWFVRHGRVRLYRASASGREFTLCIARRDSLPCLGGCPLIDGDLSPVTAQGLEPSTLYFLERQRALYLVAKSPPMAQLLSRVLADHARHLTHLSSSLALRCSMPRLVDLLLTYADERGYATERGVELNLDISHELLGTVLGMTPQMIAQNFLQLEREGILDARGKHILIRSIERLANRV